MSDTDKMIKYVNEGLLPPIPKGQTMENLNPPTLPDEDITWIGKVDTDPIMFIGVATKHGLTNVMVGISRYRIMFCGKPYFSNRVYSRSYWFQVDFEGSLWQRGIIGKKQYVGLSLKPPKYKKGVLSREILLINTATRTDGRQDKTFETTINNLRWHNHQTGKFEGGEADNLFQQIMDFYNQRRTVTLRALLLLTSDPNALEEEMLVTEPAEGQAIQITEAVEPLPSPKPAEGRVIQVAAPAPKPKATPKPIEVKSAPKPESKPAHLEKRKKSEKVSPTSICPACGKVLRPGAKFCGNCGAQFGGGATKKLTKKEPLICKDCGKAIETSWKACPYCGRLLSRSPI